MPSYKPSQDIITQLNTGNCQPFNKYLASNDVVDLDISYLRFNTSGVLMAAEIICRSKVEKLNATGIHLGTMAPAFVASLTGVHSKIHTLNISYTKIKDASTSTLAIYLTGAHSKIHTLSITGNTINTHNSDSTFTSMIQKSGIFSIDNFFVLTQENRIKNYIFYVKKLTVNILLGLKSDFKQQTRAHKIFEFIIHKIINDYIAPKAPLELTLSTSAIITKTIENFEEKIAHITKKTQALTFSSSPRKRRSLPKDDAEEVLPIKSPTRRLAI